MTDEAPMQPNNTEAPKALEKKKRREEKKAQQLSLAKREAQKKMLYNVAVGAVIILGIVWIGRSIATAPQINEEENPILSRGGVHWHADISIRMRGEAVAIPANIGLIGGHADMHTHKENDQIHIEMSRAVRKSDTRLGNFFELWGESFSSECIIDVCNGEDGQVHMYVNGEENFEYENYHMRDGDSIEIRFE